MLAELGRMFPDADVYSHVVDESVATVLLGDRPVKTTFISRLPAAKRFYQTYLPLMPLALEQLDLTRYDLVISSESGPAKGIITAPEALHVCYCHSPMRYVWDMYHQYRAEAGAITRFLMPPLAHYLRIWDRASADRVDHFVANSAFVARRIWKYYRREAAVIHPPVAVQDFSLSEQRDDFYLMVGQLVRYKRADLAVEAFTRMGKRLVVIGEGEQLKELRRIAGPNVAFLGHQPFNVIRDHYARCRALIFPGIEDFGMVPVEAMASGRPVIALRQGGALETVLDGETGIFFDQQTSESLTDAVLRFEACESDFNPAAIRAHAERFGPSRFREEFSRFLGTISIASGIPS